MMLQTLITLSQPFHSEIISTFSIYSILHWRWQSAFIARDLYIVTLLSVMTIVSRLIRNVTHPSRCCGCHGPGSSPACPASSAEQSRAPCSSSWAPPPRTPPPPPACCSWSQLLRNIFTDSAVIITSVLLSADLLNLLIPHHCFLSIVWIDQSIKCN